MPGGGRHRRDLGQEGALQLRARLVPAAHTCPLPILGRSPGGLWGTVSRRGLDSGRHPAPAGGGGWVWSPGLWLSRPWGSVSPWWVEAQAHALAPPPAPCSEQLTWVVGGQASEWAVDASPLGHFAGATR